MGIIIMRFFALIAAAMALHLRDDGDATATPAPAADPLGAGVKPIVSNPTSGGKPFCNACKANANTCVKAYTTATTAEVAQGKEAPQFQYDCIGVGDHTEGACAQKGV